MADVSPSIHDAALAARGEASGGCRPQLNPARLYVRGHESAPVSVSGGWAASVTVSIRVNAEPASASSEALPSTLTATDPKTTTTDPVSTDRPGEGLTFDRVTDAGPFTTGGNGRKRRFARPVRISGAGARRGAALPDFQRRWQA